MRLGGCGDGMASLAHYSTLGGSTGGRATYLHGQD
jgi:hypothetical protein